jgi:hypothetical protein
VLGGRQLPGGAAERPRLLRVDGRGVDDVDHGIDTHQRSCQPVPGRKIQPDRAGEHDRIVSGLPERPDGLAATSQSRSTGHRHPHNRISFSLR